MNQSGDSFVCGTVHGRVRQVLDSEQGIVESALPGVAVEIHVKLSQI